MLYMGCFRRRFLANLYLVAARAALDAIPPPCEAVRPVSLAPVSAVGAVCLSDSATVSDGLLRSPRSPRRPSSIPLTATCCTGVGLDLGRRSHREPDDFRRAGML